MAFGIVPDAGEQQWLRDMVLAENIELALFANDPELSEATQESDLLEVSGGGYARITLNASLSGSTWQILWDGIQYRAEYAPVAFLFTAPVGDVHGYYMVGQSSGVLKGVQKRAAPLLVGVPGTRVRVRPRLFWGIDV